MVGPSEQTNTVKLYPSQVPRKIFSLGRHCPSKETPILEESSNVLVGGRVGRILLSGRARVTRSPAHSLLRNLVNSVSRKDPETDPSETSTLLARSENWTHSGSYSLGVL